MINQIRELIKSVLDTSVDIEIEVPKNDSWGDYSTNIAIQMSKSQKIKPFESATLLAASLLKADKAGMFRSIEPAPNGFVNFRLSDNMLHNGLKKILHEKEKYGQLRSNGKKVLIEFVSANPTGPLHIGHGRWAVIGDCLSNTLCAAGWHVEKEFYVNDAGEQVANLVESILARMENRDVPEKGYAGEYIKELANVLGAKNVSRETIREKAIDMLLSDQKVTLESIGVIFDKWFFETELHKKGLIKKCIDKLDAKGLTFKEGNALWFKSSEYGDDKNRDKRGREYDIFCG
jgi:arginyl-tRNA synthetase